MGFFNNVQKETAINSYSKIKKYLQPKDGNKHIIMINSFSKLVNQVFGCEDKYTTQIEEILTLMQNDGYQIVDIKINSIQNQGITGQMEGFHTLITYI